MKIGFSESTLPRRGTVVIFLCEDFKLNNSYNMLNNNIKNNLVKVISKGKFDGRSGQLLEIFAPTGTDLTRIVLYGLGKAVGLDLLKLEAAGGNILQKYLTSGETELTFLYDISNNSRLRIGDAAAHIAYGARLGSYRFDKYRTKLKSDQKPSLKGITIAVADPAAARAAFRPLEKIADGVFFTKDLVTEPANVIYPESLADQCKKLKALGVEVEILGEKAMRKLGMGALLGVGQGSARESQLVVMQWRGSSKSKAPVAFIGKGVCFDTGGISIKPAANMEDMKWDMGGAGAVIGAMCALAGRKAKVNAVGVIGLVENMPSGTAQRPGDVVTSMSGQTIEVLNTDAEGRLVLADALWYTQKRFKPRSMIDLATLTGAIIISLGHENAGLFANDDTLAGQLFAAGKTEGETLWRLPLSDAYDKALESPIADMQNIANVGSGGGSITAAQFLQRFVNEVTWAHLDIAGVAWSKKDKPTSPKGATAFGVRLLDRWVRDNCEG